MSLIKNTLKFIKILFLSSFSLSSYASDRYLGLYPIEDFKISFSKCEDCIYKKFINWYFKDHYFMYPVENQLSPHVDIDRSGIDDLEPEEFSLPAVIWTGGQVFYEYVTVNPADKVLFNKTQKITYELPEKLKGVTGFWDVKTDAFFQDKILTVKGQIEDNHLIAKVFWPDAFSIDLHDKVKSLKPNETIESNVREQLNFQTKYSSRLLWRNSRISEKNIISKPKYVVAFILNGGEGNGRNGGHFSVATGRLGMGGEINSILVNNFYNLDDNDKAIVAAPTPLDKFLADVNSGQAYYRSTYITLLTFDKPDVPIKIQNAFNRLYVHYYRGDILYNAARNNCAGISVDLLRSLGFDIPNVGHENYFYGYLAYIFTALTKFDFQLAETSMGFFDEEMTRVFPAQTFTVITNWLLKKASEPSNPYMLSNFNKINSKSFVEGVSEIYFIRIPQIPSSRFLGAPPVFSATEYIKTGRVNSDQVNTKVFKVKPFPSAEKNGNAIKAEKHSLMIFPLIIFISIILSIILILLAIFRFSFSRMRRIFE